MTFFLHDFADEFDAVSDIFVDDLIFVFWGLGEFKFGVFDALGELFGVFCPSAFEAVDEFFLAGGEEENGEEFGVFGDDLECALDIDFEDRFFALADHFFEVFERGSVEVAVDFFVFEEVPGFGK